ncbi:MAG: hypothetical protein H0V65_06135 [Chitinophagales bacterium]|nr:hypothetical protein [Chitinophagales bacterium]
MKTIQLKLSFLSVVLFAFIAFNASAQTEAPASTQQKAERVQSSNSKEERRTAQQGGSRKDQFMQRLNEIQPKINEFAAKASKSKDAEFAAEANKLSTMVNDLKAKVSSFDSTPSDRQDQLEQSLKSDWNAIKEQHSKVHQMYSNSHGGESGKRTSKKATQATDSKQPAEK